MSLQRRPRKKIPDAEQPLSDALWPWIPPPPCPEPIFRGVCPLLQSLKPSILLDRSKPFFLKRCSSCAFWMRTWFSAPRPPAASSSQPGRKRSTGGGPCVFGGLRVPSLCTESRFKTLLLLVTWPGLEPQMPTGLPAASGIHSCAFPPRMTPQPCVYGREAQCPGRDAPWASSAPWLFLQLAPSSLVTPTSFGSIGAHSTSESCHYHSSSCRHKTTPSPLETETILKSPERGRHATGQAHGYLLLRKRATPTAPIPPAQGWGSHHEQRLRSQL